MSWIINVSGENVKLGKHPISKNCMLIQITDPRDDFPAPKYEFTEVHQFKFLDIEEDDDNFDETACCSVAQASKLVALLQHAIDNNMNVVVHCQMGICRSGAVCEVGTMMGLGDLCSYRIPNMLVKTRMMRALGWTYDSAE